jgi:hypothetical protein
MRDQVPDCDSLHCQRALASTSLQAEDRADFEATYVGIDWKRRHTCDGHLDRSVS